MCEQKINGEMKMKDKLSVLEKRIESIENWLKDFTLLNGGKVVNDK